MSIAPELRAPCRIVLLHFYQAARCAAPGPASRAGLCLGRPARRTPGHIPCGPQIRIAHVSRWLRAHGRHRRLRLSSSRLPRPWRPPNVACNRLRRPLTQRPLARVWRLRRRRRRNGVGEPWPAQACALDRIATIPRLPCGHRLGDRRSAATRPRSRRAQGPAGNERLSGIGRRRGVPTERGPTAARNVSARPPPTPTC